MALPFRPNIPQKPGSQQQPTSSSSRSGSSSAGLSNQSGTPMLAGSTMDVANTAPGQTSLMHQLSLQDKKTTAERRSPSQQAYDREDQMMKDIIASHQGAWAGIEKGHQANAALMQRRSASMNAAMGRNVGGGFASGMAQAWLTGQQNLDQARLQHEQQGRNLQLDWLDRQIRRRERDEDLTERATLAESGVPTV